MFINTSVIILPSDVELFTDEATFTNHGTSNLRNLHYWTPNNPHWMREIDHQRPSNINVSNIDVA